MSESDMEFVERMAQELDYGLASFADRRLFALARRGAEMQTVGHLDDGKTAILKAAGLNQTSAKILEQAEEIRTLRAALRDIHAAAGNNHLIANIARAALGEKP